jgi:hypothetical protein
MSALGHKRTSKHFRPMSALPPKADMVQHNRDVRFVPIADIAEPQQRGKIGRVRCGRLLGACLKHHIERPRSRLSNPREPAVSNDLGELRLARLRTQAFAHFLVQ